MWLISNFINNYLFYFLINFDFITGFFNHFYFVSFSFLFSFWFYHRIFQSFVFRFIFISFFILILSPDFSIIFISFHFHFFFHFDFIFHPILILLPDFSIIFCIINVFSTAVQKGDKTDRQRAPRSVGHQRARCLAETSGSRKYKWRWELITIAIPPARGPRLSADFLNDDSSIQICPFFEEEPTPAVPVEKIETCLFNGRNL